MNYVEPKSSVLSVTYDNVTYTKNIFTIPTSISGVTDEAHSNWAVGTAYTVGQFCIIPELKTIYRCTQAHTGKFPPAFLLDYWVDWGQINSYRAFTSDENIGAKTTGTDSVFEFDFSRCDTFGAVDIDFISCLLELIDDDTTTVVYSETIIGKDIGCLDFATYFYTDYIPKKAIIADGLEWLPNSTLRLSFDGAMSVGSFVYGNSENLGVTLRGSSLTIESTSKININEFTGFRTVVRYGHVNVLDASVAFDDADFSIVAEKVSNIVDKNILWIPTTNDRYSAMITIGYIENFPIPSDNPTKIQTQIRIVGVA